jgi:hypothetical protein
LSIIVADGHLPLKIEAKALARKTWLRLSSRKRPEALAPRDWR